MTWEVGSCRWRKGALVQGNARGSKGQEIGKPSHSRKRSEATDGVTCESEGRSGHPLLRAVRQALSTGRIGVRLHPLPCQARGSGCGRANVRAGGELRAGAVAWGAGVRTQRGELSTGGCQKIRSVVCAKKSAGANIQALRLLAI